MVMNLTDFAMSLISKDNFIIASKRQGRQIMELKKIIRNSLEILLFMSLNRRVHSIFCNLGNHCIQGVVVSSEVYPEYFCFFSING